METKKESVEVPYRQGNPKSSVQALVFNMVLKERIRQDKLHGKLKSEFEGITVLTEEVGEFAQAVHDTIYGGKHGGHPNIIKEAVHSMATCLKYLEEFIYCPVFDDIGYGAFADISITKVAPDDSYEVVEN